LEYNSPSKDKPYNSLLKTKEWNSYDNIPENWKIVLNKVFENYLNNFLIT